MSQSNIDQLQSQHKDCIACFCFQISLKIKNDEHQGSTDRQVRIGPKRFLKFLRSWISIFSGPGPWMPDELKKKFRNKSWESEWYWSKLWKVSLTTYESAPEKTVFPPISLFNGCSVWNSDIRRLVRLFFIEHISSSVSISFVTSKKHNFWQSRSSVSSFDSFWFLRKWFLFWLKRL